MARREEELAWLLKSTERPSFNQARGQSQATALKQKELGLGILDVGPGFKVYGV